MARVIQISDIHVVPPPGRLGQQLDSAAMLVATVDRIAADLPKYGPVDGLIVTGDLTEHGDAESYHLVAAGLDRLGLPWLAIPGNHDDRATMRACFAGRPGMEGTGPINWVQDMAGIRVVGLDTLIPGQGGGAVDDGTLAFLDTALEESAGRPVLVAMHHPPFACGIRFMDAIGLSGQEALAARLARHSGDLCIISGHVHGIHLTTVGGHAAIACPSITSTFAVDFRADAPVGFTTQSGGYMLHDWQGGFRSSYVSLGPGTGPHPFSP